MKEVFQNYEHYEKWMWENWRSRTRELNDSILKSKLMIEIKNNFTGESHRLLTKEEFYEKQSKEFIFIPDL